MAIGARITSENLSGKTATVTFVPYTGSTSGSTQNLGTKTIPFNNITTHPYGIYSLYFEEYDYTYTLTVDKPTVSVQAFAMCAPISGSTNYGLGWLNFTDLTATILDLGIDSSVWVLNNQYPIQDKGFAHHFYLNGDYNTHMVVYTDYNNEILGSYSGVTSDWSYDDMDGVWNITYDYDGGVAYYSNGEQVYTYTWDASRYNFDFDWNNYAVTKDGSFIILLYDTQLSTTTAYNVSYDNVITEMESWDETLYNKYYSQSPTHTFIPAITWDSNNNQYYDIKFFNTAGAQIGSTISLTGNTYDNYSWNHYGMNRFVVVFSNSSDINIDYKIIHFDGETNTVINTSKTRGSNYENLILEADDNHWINNEPASCLLMYFCDINNWNNLLNTNYCDIVYMLGDQTSLQTYSLTTGTTINFLVDTPYSRIDIPFVDGDLVVKILSFNSSGAQTITTSISTDGTDKGFWRYHLNEAGYILAIFSQTYDACDIIHSLTPGVLSNQITKTFQGSWQFYINSTNNVFVLDDQTDITYLNTASDGFATLTGETGSIYYPDFRYSEDNLPSDMLFLLNSGTGNMRLIKGDGVSSISTIPANNGDWNIRVGENHVMYTYGDPSTNEVKVKLYNRSLTLVNSLTTTHTGGWNNTYGVKDRYVITVDQDGYKYAYMITPTMTDYIVLSSSNNDRTPNDFYWWND